MPIFTVCKMDTAIVWLMNKNTDRLVKTCDILDFELPFNPEEVYELKDGDEFEPIKIMKIEGKFIECFRMHQRFHYRKVYWQ